MTCSEEPDAGNPHVRFCEGESQQWPIYSTKDVGFYAKLKALGFNLQEDGHQALIALHLDTDNTHIHLAANRVHLETGKAVDLWRSKETLHSVCRHLELK